MNLANTMSAVEGIKVVGHTFESRVALAMLPLGASMTLAAAAGGIGTIVFAILLMWRWPANGGWWLGWSVAAVLAAAFILRRGIATMCTFDWRVAVAPILVGAGIAIAYPGWWF